MNFRFTSNIVEGEEVYVEMNYDSRNMRVSSVVIHNMSRRKAITCVPVNQFE